MRYSELQQAELDGIDCDICHQHVHEIGPWCRLYVEDRWCKPLLYTRRVIRTADAEANGPLVNALCDYIRRRCGDDFVP